MYTKCIICKVADLWNSETSCNMHETGFPEYLNYAVFTCTGRPISKWRTGFPLFHSQETLSILYTWIGTKTVEETFMICRIRSFHFRVGCFYEEAHKDCVFAHTIPVPLLSQGHTHNSYLCTYYLYVWRVPKWHSPNGSRYRFTGLKKVSISRAQPPPTCPRKSSAVSARIKNITYMAV
jgi:hypothetical protein